MQNKAKLRKSQMNVNKVLTRDYEKKTLSERGKNKPKTNPNKAKTKPNKPNFNRRGCSSTGSGPNSRILFLKKKGLTNLSGSLKYRFICSMQELI